jgi:hypothetical protein
MKTLKNTFAILAIAFLTFACSKDEDEPIPAPGTILKDIYACGNIGNRAVFWKNNQENFLTDGTRYGSANEIFVNGSDVYVVGGEENAAEVFIPKIWKNGDITSLTSEIIAGDKISFDIEGSSTYVVGKAIATTGRDAIAIWKNGVKTVLTDGTKNARPEDIDVVGNDVYVLGYESPSADVKVYKIWKNGTIMTILTDGSNTERATKLRVLGSDVLVIGTSSGLVGGLTQSLPTVWKNGTRTIINTNPSTYLKDVLTIGSDIYVAGYEFIDGSGVIGKIWKNGVATSLSSVLNTSSAFSISSLGNDIYVSGFEKPGSYNEVGKIWKNGTVLSSFTSTTLLAVVVQSFFLTTN